MADKEGRVVGMEFETCIVWSMYFPSGTSGQHRQDLKDDFLNHLTPWIAQHVEGEKAVLICGDVNIAHTALDMFPIKPMPMIRFTTRASMDDRYSESGWRDTLRVVIPN